MQETSPEVRVHEASSVKIFPPCRLRHAFRLTIFRKFLLTLLPSFFVVAALGLGVANYIDSKHSIETLGLRVGNLSARIASALERHDAVQKQGLAEDFLGTFGTDGAVLCAEFLRFGSDPIPVASYPVRIGCKGVAAPMQLSLHLGDDDALLVVRYTNSELAQHAWQRSLTIFTVLITAFLATLLSAGLAFRLIVGRRIAVLHASMTQASGTGERTLLHAKGRDELAEIIRAWNTLVNHEERREKSLQDANEALADEGRRDPLTGLFNRRYFNHWVVERTSQGLRNESGVIGLIDVDHFKRVNDTHGHSIGDEVLVEISNRLKQATRSSDLLVRWGGEEIVVYMSGQQDSRVFAHRLLEAIFARPIHTTAGPLLVTASLGLVRLPLRVAGFELSIEQALVFADRCLYLAKESGRELAVTLESLNFDHVEQAGIVESDLSFAASRGLVDLLVVKADGSTADFEQYKGIPVNGERTDLPQQTWTPC